MAEQESNGKTTKFLLKKFPELTEGVEWKPLGEIATINRGIRVTKKKLSDDCKVPVFQNSLAPLGFFKESNRKSQTFVITAGAAGQVGYSDIDFWAADDCITFTNNDKLINKFIFYFLQTKSNFIKSNVRKGAVPRISKSVFANLQIPLPPTFVQNEIVKILDKFTSLENELEKELELRKKQYEWARQKLLEIKNVPFVQIKDVCKVEKGKTPIQKALPGDYPLVVTTDERKSSSTYQFDCKAVCLSLVSARGHGVAQVSRVFYQEGKFALGNILCAIIPNDENQLSAKFLRYYLFYKKDSLLVPLMKGGANVSLHTSDIEKVRIPLPPISEQNRIAEILDKFETLTASQTQGIPAEIAMRKKQYEHYRDLLLSF